MDSKMVHLFWKDTSRRFIGANQKLLDTFGFSDVSEILGKTDEDLGCYIDGTTFAEDEREVLTKGKVIRNRIGRIILQGRICTVLANKEPMYENGKIVGLFGFFLNLDENVDLSGMNSSHHQIDLETGIMNAEGIASAMGKYNDEWLLSHKNFAVIRISIPEYHRGLQTYGDQVLKELSVEISRILTEIFKNSALLGRLYAANYVAVLQCKTKQEGYDAVDAIREKFNHTHELAGYIVTIRPKMDIYFADETEDIRELTTVATGGYAADSEEKRFLEERLKQNNLQITTLTRIMSGGVLLFEMISPLEIKIVYGSDRLYRVLETTEDSFQLFLNGREADGICLQDEELVKNELIDAVQIGRSIDVSYRYVTQKGELFWVGMRGNTVGQQDGHPLLLCSIQKESDFTKGFEEVLDSALVSVVVRQEKTKEVLYQNMAMKKLVDAYFDGSVNVLKEEIDKKRDEGKIETKVENFSNQGVQFEVMCRGRYLFVRTVENMWNGRSALVTYIMDITSSREEEKKVQTILESIPAAIAVYHMGAGERRAHATYVSRRMWSLMNFHEGEDAEFLHIIFNHLTKKEKDGWVEYITKPALNREVLHFEYRSKGDDGKYRWYEVSCTPVTHADGGCDYYCVYTDIGERKQRERESAEKKQFEMIAMAEHNANEAKTKFLSSMSHDIRTPLNAITGFIKMTKSSDDLDQVRDILQKMEASSNHLLTLVNDILDISKIESGEMHIHRNVFSFSECMEHIYDMVKQDVIEKNLDYTFEKEIVHDAIYGDGLRITQIYLNLLSNAVKYTKAGGSITVRLVESNENKDGISTFTFVVADTGIGMDEEFQKNMYDPFVRANDSNTNQTQGSGLGLAITKRIVDLVNGTIDCDSTPGVGTTFTVVLNLHLATEGGHIETEKNLAQVDITGMRVLVAEDNDINWEIVEWMLDEHGVKTEHAENGKVCIDMLSQAQEGYYDAVLMDIQMPVMDGRTSTVQIRQSKDAWFCNIPIVALSADAFAEDIKLSLQKGMNAHIAKPIREDELVRMLQKISFARME